MKIKFIVIIVTIVVMGGFISFYVINKQYEPKFNLADLTYTLPEYTKMCLPTKKLFCSDGKCKKTNPAVFVLYDEINNIVYRCDNQPCDSYNVRSDISGLYTNLTPIVPNGMMIKIDESGKYVEVVSFGLDMLMSYGQCK